MNVAIRRAISVCLPLLASCWAFAQGTGANGQQTADTLTCKDGEKFVGHLLSASASTVVFKSDAAGQVSISWDKIQELHTSAQFAVLTNGQKLRGPRDASKVPQGVISVANNQVRVVPAAQGSPQEIPSKNVAQLVAEAAFQKALSRERLWEGWSGGASGGIAYTNSTQQSQSYTAALNLTRSIPGEDWLDQRNRTLLNFNEAYGEISQPSTPTTKTSITHLGLEQDWYLNPRLFAFGQALLDHNYSQGLDLQQDYGGGFGFVVIKQPREEFDVKASLDYIDQRFTLASQNKSLIGSTFGENYSYKFAHGILLTELGSFIPAWNNTNAYSGVVNANLTFPVYHRLGFTFGGIDNYLNDPPLGFKKNSFTLTLGATYSLK